MIIMVNTVLCVSQKVLVKTSHTPSTWSTADVIAHICTTLIYTESLFRWNAISRASVKHSIPRCINIVADWDAQFWTERTFYAWITHSSSIKHKTHRTKLLHAGVLNKRDILIYQFSDAWAMYLVRFVNSRNKIKASPSRASYRVTFVDILKENWPHHNGTTLCCIGICV